MQSQTDLERAHRLILEAVGDGIYGVDGEGRTTFVNPAGARMLGWPPEELIGHVMHRLVHHSHQDGSLFPLSDCPIYAAFRDGNVHKVGEDWFWRRDGSGFPVEYTSTPILDAGVAKGAVVVFRDITRRKAAENELRSALDEVQALRERLEQENDYLQNELRTHIARDALVGTSVGMRSLRLLITQVAPTPASVLITGESGTGKELVARAIHEASARRDKPLIRVNCAAIPADLFESEFFGHVKGAFTGATQDRSGRFELADGGTLFLDEVGEIPLALQGKLLRVLQEQQFERIGESRTRKVDVRLIAATNRNLAREVAERQFREDLYFRLNVFPIPTIPLRERKEDIPLLAQQILRNTCERMGRPHLELTPEHLEALAARDWPGNVRELENLLERQVILAAGPGGFRIPMPDQPTLSKPGRHPDDPVLTERDFKLLEQQNLMAALRQSDGRIFGEDGAAALLGIRPTTLASRLKNMGINARDFRNL